jgi:hypothetical protein
MYQCPVCYFRELKEPAIDFAICPCCGTEFGYSDAGRTFEELRRGWIWSGKKWHSRVFLPPNGWNADKQLLTAGYGVKFGAASFRQTPGEIRFDESVAKFG